MVLYHFAKIFNSTLHLFSIDLYCLHFAHEHLSFFTLLHFECCLLLSNLLSNISHVLHCTVQIPVLQLFIISFHFSDLLQTGFISSHCVENIVMILLYKFYCRFNLLVEKFVHFFNPSHIVTDILPERISFDHVICLAEELIFYHGALTATFGW